jgi:hypothetical protein
MLLLASMLTHGQIYKCKTPSGGTEFSQVPCGKDAHLIQSQRDSIDTTNPPADPFGVQRDRDRQQAETERLQQKFYDNLGKKPVGTASAPRQISQSACDKADRDAKIEAGHARKDAAAIKRAQKVADWECGRTIEDDPEPVATKRRPSVIPGRTGNPAPTIASCDSSGCWDTNGARYNRAAGNTFFGPNGVACTGTPGAMVCP